MRPNLLEELGRRVLVCDGAMGSLLAAQGLRLRNTTEANATAPEVVVGIHREYRAAGADILLTNTFAANRIMLSRAGLTEDAPRLQSAAVALCREGAGPDGYVAADAGPTGALLEPWGDLSRAEAVEAYREQLANMLTAEVDLVVLETFEAIGEIEAAVEGVRAAGCAVPIACMASFSNPSGRTMMGHDGATFARAMAGLGVEIVGANCGHPDGLREALLQMSRVTDLPLMVKANAGVPRLQGGTTVFDGTPEQSAALARDLVAIGARLLGGCCGTTPEHIAAVARATA